MKTVANKETGCAYVPVTDIFETTNEYVLKMEMPGMAKEQLDITLDDDQLEIKGLVKTDVPEGKELLYSECSSDEYYRKFKLGNDINRNAINADLENGVLTLTIQKREEVKPKKIDISVK